MKGKQIHIQALMGASGVKFGTSGARGLVSDMTDEVCYAYALAFLQYLRTTNELTNGSPVAIAGDLRPSTPRILRAVAAAIEDAGHTVINSGQIPSPAIAFYGVRRHLATIMVTGSHIPDDRNGIKFNKATGEILKHDEQGIAAQSVSIPEGRFTADGALKGDPRLPSEDDEAKRLYVERYVDFFGSDALAGQHIGLYEHSSVARELLGEILSALGAGVTRLGRSEAFIPVDTEAVRPEDRELASQWASRHHFDAIVSTDGDGDRPLVSDEHGRWLRGDVTGVLCAGYLGARFVATPVSSNTVAEKSGWFEQIKRTRIGSPYVIAAMNEAIQSGGTEVAGYEANGGFLTGTTFNRDGVTLEALPTRDAVLVIVALLAYARHENLPLSELVARIPSRYTASDRVKAFPTELARQKLEELLHDSASGAFPALDNEFAAELGGIDSVDTTDGVRITFKSGEIVHLRPSGNAPELRCYTEADSNERAEWLVSYCIEKLANWKDQAG